MTDKDEKKIYNEISKTKTIPREITQKTNTEAETLNPRRSGNSNSITDNKSLKGKEMNSIEYKKSESGKISDGKFKNESCLIRLDSFGNPISKNGKQKISFIDKKTNNNLVDVIKIESYKIYNKMEELSNPNMQNNCCLIV